LVDLIRKIEKLVVIALSQPNFIAYLSNVGVFQFSKIGC